MSVAKDRTGRFKDVNWHLATGPNHEITTASGGAIVAVLMDIRDELQRLNRVFACPNFLDVPRSLRRIAKNTAKPRKATT